MRLFIHMTYSQINMFETEYIQTPYADFSLRPPFFTFQDFTTHDKSLRQY